MDGLTDALTERVRDLAGSARRSLLASGHVNGLVLYALDRREHTAMLDVLRVADARMSQRHPELVEATAELLGMPISALVAMVAEDVAHERSAQTVGRRWMRRLLWRLRALRPAFVVFTFESFTVTAKDPARFLEAKRLAGEGGLGMHPDSHECVAVIGVSPIRCFAQFIPIIRTPDGVRAGDAEFRDSWRGDGYVGGLLGAVYMPNPC